MAELVDAPVLGTGGSNPMEVQVLSSAQVIPPPRWRLFISTNRRLVARVDAPVLGTGGSNPMEVQFLSSAQVIPPPRWRLFISTNRRLVAWVDAPVLGTGGSNPMEVLLAMRNTIRIAPLLGTSNYPHKQGATMILCACSSVG